MIDRYSRTEMTDIWSTQKKYQKWLDIEIAACEALVKLNRIPEAALKNIKKKADFDINRIDEIEKTVKHDVIAFLTSVAEKVGPDSRYIHLGLTSSDILDTALALQLRDAADIIIKDIEKLMEVLKKKAIEHKFTMMIGRSHGIHAEPTTFGLKLALWYEEMSRNLDRLISAKKTISYGKISGAVGTFANVDPFVEEYVCEKLGLEADPVSTQIIQRDRHAEYMTSLAILASSLEKFSVEIRHLQRTEVYEAEEYFSKGQKGSSAMPHKRNPIASENISGLARVVRANASAALENIALWHERDISHSSVERVILPDSTILIDYMLNRFTDLIDNLLVYPNNMLKNIYKMNGIIHSQRILIALAENGLSREDAYRIVQRNAMRVWEKEESFNELLKSDNDIKNVLTDEQIDACFSMEYHFKNVEKIFERVFGELPEIDNKEDISENVKKLYKDIIPRVYRNYHRWEKGESIRFSKSISNKLNVPTDILLEEIRPHLRVHINRKEAYTCKSFYFDLIKSFNDDSSKFNLLTEQLSRVINHENEIKGLIDKKNTKLFKK